MPKKEPTRRLNIFLIKQDIKKIDGAISESAAADNMHEITHSNNKKIGTLITHQAPSTPPRWLKYFASTDQIGDLDLRTKHASAALFVETANRIFAITFGYGRSLVNQDAVERNFGLKVVLNTVPPESIRSIDKTEFEKNEIHSREQASQATDIGDFGINIDRDILRAVSGTPGISYKNFGRTISGADSLSCVTKEPIEKLRQFLREVLDVYEKDDYKKNYAWVDNIIALKDKVLIEDLNQILVEKINQTSTDTIWMAVPEIIDWDEIDGFAYKNTQTDELKSDISLDYFRDTFSNGSIDLNNLKKTNIFALRAQDSSIYKKWSAYACIHAEIEKDKRLYILSSASWYEINKNFAKEIDDFYKGVGYNKIVLPNWKKDWYEKEYNEHVRDSDKKYALMDRVKIKASGASPQLEFCDLATTAKDIIHVKHYGQSAVLSHLFTQGTVSAQLFISDSVFRSDVQTHLPGTHKHIAPKSAPISNDYLITYAIGSSKFGNLKLPFFSQVSLKQAVHFLKDTLKFKVNLTKIDIVP